MNAVNGTLSGQTKSYAYSINYAPHGGLSSLGEGNNVAPVWTYNNRKRLTNPGLRIKSGQRTSEQE